MRSLVLFSCLIAAGCGSPGATLVEEAQGAVKGQLRDPASALFDQEQPALAFPDQGLACGQVNSKNAFGGYAGSEPYAYARGEGAHLASGDWEAFKRLHDRCLAGLQQRTEKIRARTAALKADS